MGAEEWVWEHRPGLAGPHGGAARPVMMGRTGAVACAHPLASLVGLDVLREGGNAFDAMVAACAVVPLGEPHMSGIGGLGNATIYDAKSDSCMTLDFGGAAPASATPLPGSHAAMRSGLDSAQVPGVIAGWAALLDRYGTMKLERLLRPAVDHARRGVPVSVMLGAVIDAVGRHTGPYGAKPSDGFTADARTAELFMPGGTPLRPGELLVQPELAATLETIGREGPRAFYRGSIAGAIVRACAAAGGHITHADLAAIEAEWRPSLQVPYRGYQVHTSGSQLLETLGLLAGSDVAALGLHSPEHVHMLVECLKLAQADRVASHADDSFDPLRLLEEDHLSRRRAEIRRERAAVAAGDEPLGTPKVPAGTTTLVTADRHGNLVAVLQTLGRHFGGRTLVGDTGMILNNLYGHSFRTQRTNSTGGPSVVMSPAGAPFLAAGSVGGPSIPQTVPQVISNVIDFRLNPQAAVEAPRVRVFTGHRVMIEARIARDVRAALERRGHQWDVVGEWAFGEGQLGRVQLVVRDGSTTLHAASDPRGSGAAAAS